MLSSEPTVKSKPKTAPRSTKPAAKPASKTVPRATSKTPAKAPTSVAKPAAVAPKKQARPDTPTLDAKDQAVLGMLSNSLGDAATPEFLARAHAMLQAPESAYMGDSQQKLFAELLQGMLHATRQRLHLADQENRDEPSTLAADPADRASMEEERDMILRSRGLIEAKYRELQKALRRIEDGSFGWCEISGDPIGIARLLVQPTATRSVEAQANEEKRREQFTAD